MRTLTTAEKNAINNAVITHDYSAQRPVIYNAREDDEFGDWPRFIDWIEKFEDDEYDALLDSTSEDIGGMVTYFKDDKLIAFYDYENFKGAVFK